MPLLTVRQAAEQLGVSQSLVYGLISSRQLRHCRIGNGRGTLRIPVDAIGEYLARCTFDVKEEKPAAPPVKLKYLRP
jgi:excisionase family DNA binding protein